MAEDIAETRNGMMENGAEWKGSTPSPAAIPSRPSDADDAMLAFEGTDGEGIEIDEKTNKRLLRTIDWHLMPLMCVIYGMSILDKITLTFASAMGMGEDLHLVDDNYQWLGSIFFVGFLVWEYPTNLLLQRLPIAKYCSFCIVVWGLILSCFAAVKNFEGALVLRFFMGAAEASVMPAFALITSQWYRTDEQATRTAFWYSFTGVGNVVGCLLGYGIAVGTRTHGTVIESWKVLFLATGLSTIALGVWFWWVVPDSQLNARWLNAEDRVLAVERVRVNQQGIGNKHFKLHQLKGALTDPMTWAIFLYSLFLSIPIGGIITFFTELVTGFGYTREESLLYSAPAGAVLTVGVVVSAYIGTYFNQRLLVGAGGLIVGILGMVLIVALPISNNVGRLVGYYMAYMAATTFSSFLTMISSNVAGYTKKTTVAALYVMGYGIGNLIGPQTFRPEHSPRYIPAVVVIIVCWGLCLFDIYFVWWWYRRQNAKKARVRAQPGYKKVPNQEWLDLTDNANDEFRYIL